MTRALSTLTLLVVLVATACGGLGEPWGAMELPYVADGDVTHDEPHHLAVKVVTADTPAVVCKAMFAALGRHGFEARTGGSSEISPLGDVKLKRGDEVWDLNCSDVDPEVPSEGMWVVVMRADSAGS